VPVFLDDLGPFRTTRFALEQALAFHKKTPLSRPTSRSRRTRGTSSPCFKTGDIVEYITREIEWVKDQAYTTTVIRVVNHLLELKKKPAAR
jgi:hypothetical protein